MHLNKDLEKSANLMSKKGHLKRLKGAKVKVIHYFEVLVGEILCWFKSSWPQSPCRKGFRCLFRRGFFVLKSPENHRLSTILSTVRGQK